MSDIGSRGGSDRRIRGCSLVSLEANEAHHLPTSSNRSSGPSCRPQSPLTDITASMIGSGCTGDERLALDKELDEAKARAKEAGGAVAALMPTTASSTSPPPPAVEEEPYRRKSYIR